MELLAGGDETLDDRAALGKDFLGAGFFTFGREDLFSNRKYCMGVWACNATVHCWRFCGFVDVSFFFKAGVAIESSHSSLVKVAPSAPCG